MLFCNSRPALGHQLKPPQASFAMKYHKDLRWEHTARAKPMTLPSYTGSMH